MNRIKVKVRIDKIKNREQAATSGPWEIDLHRDHKETGIICRSPGIINKSYPDRPGILWSATQTHSDNWIRQQDADFIEQARMDIPWLLDELEKALEEISNS